MKSSKFKVILSFIASFRQTYGKETLSQSTGKKKKTGKFDPNSSHITLSTTPRKKISSKILQANLSLLCTEKGTVSLNS